MISPDEKISLFLRINPNIDPDTHKYLTTGIQHNKFGVLLQRLPHVFSTLKKCKHIKITGIHFHIGSQILDFENFKSLSKKVNFVMDKFRENGVKIEHVNLGGGLGCDYKNPENLPDFEAYFGIFY